MTELQRRLEAIVLVIDTLLDVSRATAKLADVDKAGICPLLIEAHRSLAVRRDVLMREVSAQRRHNAEFGEPSGEWVRPVWGEGEVSR